MRICSVSLPRSTSGASILLIKIIRGRLRSAAIRIRRRVSLSIPLAASMTTTTDSTAGKQAIVWPMKSAMPGVSTTQT